MIPPSVRRLTIFAAVFGGVMAFVIWQAGGLRGDRAQHINTGPRPDTPDDMMSVGPGGIGRGEGVRVTKDDVAPVDGQPIPYRVWEAWWEHQEPRDGDGPDQRVMATEDFHILFFHLLPSVRDPYPRAVEGPDTTRIDAGRADWDSGASQTVLRADLFDGVVVTHHGADGDLVLQSERLFIEEVQDGARERQIARTDARVTMEQSGLKIVGTGLDLDLGSRPVATLRSDVRADILTATALIGAPSMAGGEPAPAVITCTGPGRLEALDRSPARNARRRWRVTFEDDVVVEQSGGRLTANRLELEFLSGDDRERGLDDLLLVVADGNVVAGTPDDGDGNSWTIETPHLRTTRGQKEEFVTTCGRGTTMHFSGALGDAATKGRVEVHSEGQATLTTDAEPPRSGRPARTRVRFTESAVFRQFDAAGDLTSEVTAPEILLLGTRVVDADGGTRPAPDALTATGNEQTPVTFSHRGVRATSRVALWKTRTDKGLERLLLNGAPVARFDDTSGWNPLGGGTTAQPAVLELSAGDEIEILYARAPQTGDAGTATVPADEAVTPTAHGRGGVTLRRLVGDEETYRLDAETVDVGFDAQQQPTSLRAYGNAHLQGRGDGSDATRIDLYGERFRTDREGDAAAASGDLWADTRLSVSGDSRTPARAVIEVPAEKDTPRRTHEIRAQEITYEERGTLVVARRGAVAEINRRDEARAGDAGILDDVTISGTEIRAEILPRSSGTGTIELARIVATAPAGILTKTSRVTGDEVLYDHRSGTASVTGRPARAVTQQRAATRHASYENLVVSPTIQIEFDGPLVGGGNAEPRRLRCDGGRIVLHDAGSSTKSGAMARTTVVASGPIAVQPGFASAEREVEILMETETAPGRWTQTARLTCERANLDLDPGASAPGTRSDIMTRIRRATAVGTREAPVRAVSGGVVAIADKVEIEGQWLHFSSPFDRRVVIDQTEDDGTVSTFTFLSGWWNIMTHEWDRLERAKYD